MPFEFTDGDLDGTKVITATTFSDKRGELAETYLEPAFRDAGIEADFIQDKYSRSQNGVLRGLHYQRGEDAQAKLVRCAAGAVFDVIVDLREDSETFGQHSTHILTAENNRMVYHPRGFAHGYLALSDDVLFEYKVDNDYAPDQEAGIAWDDPTLDIEWPITEPITSDRDKELLTFEEAREDDLFFSTDPS